jgi:hypothetical protein
MVNKTAKRSTSHAGDLTSHGYRSRVMGVIGNAVAVSVAQTIGTALRKHTGL